MELDRATVAADRLRMIVHEEYDGKVPWPKFVADKQARYQVYRTDIEKSLKWLDELAKSR